MPENKHSARTIQEVRMEHAGTFLLGFRLCSHLTCVVTSNELWCVRPFSLVYLGEAGFSWVTKSFWETPQPLNLDQTWTNVTAGVNCWLLFSFLINNIQWIPLYLISLIFRGFTGETDWSNSTDIIYHQYTVLYCTVARTSLGSKCDKGEMNQSDTEKQNSGFHKGEDTSGVQCVAVLLQPVRTDETSWIKGESPVALNKTFATSLVHIQSEFVFFRFPAIASAVWFPPTPEKHIWLISD